MSLRDAYCIGSGWAEAGLAHPLALPAYIIACGIMAVTMTTALRTEALSHFANVMLILIAAAQYRSGKVMQREVDAIAEAQPGVDHEAIRAGA